MAARRLIPSLPLCLLLSSCLPYLGGGPPDENAMFREQQKMVWGEGGEFCAMAFGDRVDPDAFPAFIAAQEKKCAQGDAMACDDEADARLGGCAGTPRDRDRGMAELQRREVLDLVAGHQNALVEQRAVLPEPLLEADDPGVLEKAQELHVVDVAVGVHVTPPQRHVGAVSLSSFHRHGPILPFQIVTSVVPIAAEWVFPSS